MHQVLITGVSGFIGSNLAEALLRQGICVRGLHRNTSNLLALRGIDIEHAVGDVLDPSSLDRAVRGCDTVFHTAALVSYWKKDYRVQLAVNVEGTRNIAAACLHHGVARLVHTSSIAALGLKRDGGVSDETTPFEPGETIGYRYSKHRAELEVLSAVELGLNAVILNPTVVIGARDISLHGSQIVRDVRRGLIPAYIYGGLNVVGVDDVVAGHIAAASKGKSGERYILGGTNLTYREFLTLIARVVGAPPPRIRVPVWTVKVIAAAAGAVAALTGKKPWMASDMTRNASVVRQYSSAKAEHELGYHPRPIDEAIRQACAWYQSVGMLS